MNAPSLSRLDCHALTPAELRRAQQEAARAAGLEPFFSDPLAHGGRGPELAVIPPGRFNMGAAPDTLRFGELPAQTVAIDRPFAIGRYCVTAEEFERFAAATGFYWQEHLMRAEGRQPVINVSHDEALHYLDWLSAETGQRYRLPSEAEWEYAARAGSATEYCFGDRLTCGEANIHSLRPPATPLKGWRRFLPFCAPLNRAVEVGSYPPNVWGLFEVHGNVWEITASPWVGPLDAENRVKPKQEEQWRVCKGGSWFEGPIDARAAARKPRMRNELDTNLGFRVVREIG